MPLPRRSTSPRPLALLALGVLGMALGGGCASAPSRPDPEVERVRMDPMHFVARQGADGGVVVDQQDAESLFRDAGVAFEQARYDDAIRAYDTLLADFPASEFAPAARYNTALAHERSGRYDDAIRLYQAIVAAAPASPDALDAMFQIAACHEARERWVEADTVLAALLERPKLASRDVVEATVRRGHAMFALDRLDDAEGHYRAVLQRRRGGGEPRSTHMSRTHFAQAQFGLGRVEHTRFSAHPIRLPQAVMERDIQDKASTFLRAQAAYLRAMNYKELDISAGALLRIGRLYEEFFDDLVESPLPPELANQEEVDVYLEELRKKIRPLISRAVYVHKRNLRFANRLGEDHELVTRTKEHLERLTKLLASIPEPPPTETDEVPASEEGEEGGQTARKTPEDLLNPPAPGAPAAAP